MDDYNYTIKHFSTVPKDKMYLTILENFHNIIIEYKTGGYFPYTVNP